jgi:ubiquinone/menaquinone biosynthesis C-methylase UbiE
MENSNVLGNIGKLPQIKWKEFNEFNYWRERKDIEGVLANSHYKHFCTSHFGLDESFYRNKVILDVGCGPRGSLEWATMASRRIGLDPLALEYLKLGTDKHKMEYICSSGENIPLRNGACDAVFSFNSLDHVAAVDQTLEEIIRITAPGGLFLLLVEVNHYPTDCEPHQLTPKNIIDYLKETFICESLEVYKPIVKGMYQSILVGEKFSNPVETIETGYMSARFVRKFSR